MELMDINNILFISYWSILAISCLIFSNYSTFYSWSKVCALPMKSFPISHAPYNTGSLTILLHCLIIIVERWCKDWGSRWWLREGAGKLGAQHSSLYSLIKAVIITCTLENNLTGLFTIIGLIEYGIWIYLGLLWYCLVYTTMYTCFLCDWMGWSFAVS